jgi:succinoglycan biosynthesis protein ExoM
LNVAICVATYRRPAQLAALCEALARLERGPETLLLAVADDDAEGSARAVVNAARARLPFPVVYEVEPERNISLARNRSIRIALKLGAEWLAFIDDDEVPHPDWLAALLRVQRMTGADVVTGPVIARPPDGTPRWLRGAFSRDHAVPSGTAVPLAETANALVSRAVVEHVAAATGAPFEPEFGLSGGGDTRFFLRARLAGARMVWAAEAVVVEEVPPSRARLGWLLRRSFRVGNAGAFVERGVLPALRWMPRRLAASFFHLVVAAGLLAVAPVRALRYAAQAAGSIAGMLGIRYSEYR